MIDILQITQILNKLFPYIIGAIGGIASLYASGYCKEYFDERARIAKHKREVARQVLQICNEASTSNFKLLPRDIEHVNSVLTNVEGINSNMEAIMNRFISLWQLIAQISQSHLGKEETKDLREMLKEVEEKRKRLVDWANSIRIGR